MRRKVLDINSLIKVVVLIVLDQGIKLMVKGYYGTEKTIIPKLLYFKPKLNDKYSWFNSMFSFGGGKAFHILLVLIMIFLVYYLFKYIYTHYNTNTGVEVLKILIFSGAICSLIDKVFWNGSLDYVYLYGLFIFDLKDIYITAFEIFAVILLIKNWQSVSKIDDKKLFKDFCKLIKKDIFYNHK